MNPGRELKYCVRCSQSVQVEDRFCRECGATLSDPRSAPMDNHPLVADLHQPGRIPISTSDKSCRLPALSPMHATLRDGARAWKVPAAMLTRLIEASFAPAPLDTWGLAAGTPDSLGDILLLRNHRQQKPAGTAATCQAFYLPGPSTRVPFALPEYCLLDLDPSEFVTDPFRHLLLQITPLAFLEWRIEQLDRSLFGQWHADDEGGLFGIHESALTGEDFRQRLSNHETFLERLWQEIPNAEVREMLAEILLNLREIQPRIPSGPLGPVLAIAWLQDERRQLPLRLADAASCPNESIAGLVRAVGELRLAGAGTPQAGRRVLGEARRLSTWAHVLATGISSQLAMSPGPIVAAENPSREPWHVTSAVLQKVVESSFENAQLCTAGVLTGTGTTVCGYVAAGQLFKSPGDAVGVALVSYALGRPLIRDFELPYDYWELPTRLQAGPVLRVECVPGEFWQGRQDLRRMARGVWREDEGAWLSRFDCPLSGRSVRPKLLRHKEDMERMYPKLEGQDREYVDRILSRLEEVLAQLPEGPLSPLVCSATMEGETGRLPLCVDGASARRSPVVTAAGLDSARMDSQTRVRRVPTSAALSRLAGKATRADEWQAPAVEQPAGSPGGPPPDILQSGPPAGSRLADRLQALDSRIRRRMERLGSGTSPTAAAAPTPPPDATHRQALMKGLRQPPSTGISGSAEKISLELFPAEWTGYVRAFRQHPVLHHVRLCTTGYRRLEDLRLIVEMADFSYPYEQMIPLLDRRSPVELTDLPMSLKPAAFRQVSERVTGRITASLSDASGRRLQVAHADVPVLAFNECPISLASEGELIACFVQPNDPGVIEVTKLAAQHVQRLNGSSAFCGYQVQNAESIHNMVEALYLAVQKDLHITYINPPPSFELGRRLQRLRPPSQIIFRERQGTCFDLALLFAACLEHIGLHPLVFLIRGHAFFGYFVGETNYRTAVSDDWAVVENSLRREAVVAINSTSFCEGAGFRQSREHGSRLLADAADFEFAIDVARARQQQFLPLPFDS